MAGAGGAITGAVLLAFVGRRLLALPLPVGHIARVGAATALMATVVLSLHADQGIVGLALTALVGVLTYGGAAIALNILGARAAALGLARRASRIFTWERLDARS